MMDRLIKHFITAGLDNKQAEKMAAVFKVVTLRKMDYWLEENEVCNYLGFIVDGMCRHFFIDSKGDEITRWVSLEGQFVVSVGSFLQGTNSNESIQAIAPTTILNVSKDQWDVLYRNNEFARTFWVKSIQKYLIGLEDRLYSHISLDASERYNYLFRTYPHMIKKVPNKYLASILGVNPRHLSRLTLGKK